MWRKLKDEVRADQLRFDDEIKKWTAGYEGRGGRIHCRRGCRNCCTLAVNATFTEALCVTDLLSERHRDALAGHAARLLTAARSATGLKEWLRGHRHSVGFCPLLEEDGACGVYLERPFSCRSLLSTRPADWCAVDLAALHPLEKEAFLSSLDPTVVAWPAHYAAPPQETGFAFESRAVFRLTEAFGFSLGGNLPYLLWLEEEFRLSTIFPQGGEALARLLREKRVDVPFLLDLRL